MPVGLEEVYWKGVLQPRGEISEKCYFNPLPGKKPTARLEIEEFSADDQSLIQRVVVVIEMERPEKEFLLGNPLWELAPELFMFQFIYATFWRLKMTEAGFGRPKVKELFVYDQGSGVTAHLLVATEVFFDTGAPIALVANYANVHLVDQLEAALEKRQLDLKIPTFIEKISFLRGVWLQNSATILESFDADMPRANEPTSVYIDEVGDLGFKEPGHFYGIFGLAFDDRKLPQVRERLTGLIERHWPGPTKPRELHFSKIPDTKRMAVIEEIAAIFYEFVDCGNCFVTYNFAFLRHLVRGEIEFRRDEERPSQTVIADLLASPDGHVANRLLMLATEDLISTTVIERLLAAPSVSVFHDRKRGEWMNEAVEDGYKAAIGAIDSYVGEQGDAVARPTTSFAIVNSEEDPCLWLSDWLAWELGGWLRNQRVFSPGFLEAVKKISFFTFSEDGERVQIRCPGGDEMRRYPDRAREIVALRGHGSHAR